MATTQAPTRADEIRSMLIWARANGFRVSEIESGGVRIKVDDLRTESPAVAKGPKPRDVHEAFALEHGIDIPKDVDDEDDGLEDGA